MELLPAIDLLDGDVVRLTRGEYKSAVQYSSDPLAVARDFLRQGADRLHVVDLNGARSGIPGNLNIIESLLNVGLRVQVGGGIRTAEAADRWVRLGVSRIVVGTIAVSNASVVMDLCARYAQQVIVAIDVRGKHVATDGWERTSERTAIELALEVEKWGAAGILYTNIVRDGTGEGPDVDGTMELQKQLQIPVIASGGIGTLEHIRQLNSAGIHAAICGKALYRGAFSLREALRTANEEKRGKV